MPWRNMTWSSARTIRSGFMPGRSSRVMGKTTWIRVPSPCSLRTSILPRSIRTRSAIAASPIPRSSGRSAETPLTSNPLPLSSTVRSTLPSWTLRRSDIRPASACFRMLVMHSWMMRYTVIRCLSLKRSSTSSISRVTAIPAGVTDLSTSQLFRPERPKIFEDRRAQIPRDPPDALREFVDGAGHLVACGFQPRTCFEHTLPNDADSELQDHEDTVPARRAAPVRVAFAPLPGRS